MTVTQMLDGIVALVEAAGAAAGLTGLTVKALSAGDVQSDGEVRLAPPAAAVFLEAGAMQAASADGRTYADTPLWSVLIVGQDLTGGAAPAKAAYAILDAVRGYLAGKVITAGSHKALVLLQGYETVVVGGGRAVLRLALQLDTSFQGS